jgi:sigma-E factor negative regulatory protein RseA
MTEALDEQLSALLDGELPPEECELLLKRLERDSELRARFARFALVGEALRGRADVAPAGRALFIARVHAAVAEVVPVPVLEDAPRANRRPRLVAGLAVAASVALLALVLLARAPGTTGTPPAETAQNTQQPAEHAATVVPEAAPRTSLTASSYVTPPKPTRIPSGELAHYVVAHSDFASAIPSGAMLTSIMVEEPAAEAAPQGPAGPAGSPPP